MGFGYLFAGYLLAFFLSLNPYGSLFALAGYGLMLAGLWRLIPYHKNFRYSFFVLLPMLPTALYRSVAALSHVIPAFEAVAGWAVGQAVALVEFCLIFAFHMALFYGIYGLARQVGVPKLMAGAARNAIFVGGHFILYLVSVLPLPETFIEGYKRIMGAPILLLQLCWVIFNVVLIWQCYRFICPEGEEDVPLRVSRFAFVNKVREEMERREQEGLEATKQHALKNQREYVEGQKKIQQLKQERLERQNRKKRK